MKWNEMINKNKKENVTEMYERHAWFEYLQVFIKTDAFVRTLITFSQVPCTFPTSNWTFKNMNMAT